MGHSPSSKSLNPLLEKMSAHILKTAEESKVVDIAFVLDTTSSMEPSIGQVQNNLVQFLEQLQAKQKGNTYRVALLEYRDKNDRFLNRINTDFTSNLNQVQKAVKGLNTDGGGDAPEAVLDALLAAKNKLSWQPNAKRIVVLIGDAPPHPTALDGAHDEAAVIDQYRTAGTQIAVYPIFSQNEAIK
jgi:Mg-chelatase subunit ChlD